MVIWHGTDDASRIPEYVSSGQDVEVWVGTYPIEGGQAVWVEVVLQRPHGKEMACKMPAQWHSNNEQRNNSYWHAQLGSFEVGDRVEYRVYGSRGAELVSCNETYSFDVS